jgi:hypothetical protein
MERKHFNQALERLKTGPISEDILENNLNNFILGFKEGMAALYEAMPDQPEPLDNSLLRDDFFRSRGQELETWVGYLNHYGRYRLQLLAGAEDVNGYQLIDDSQGLHLGRGEDLKAGERLWLTYAGTHKIPQDAVHEQPRPQEYMDRLHTYAGCLDRRIVVPLVEMGKAFLRGGNLKAISSQSY